MRSFRTLATALFVSLLTGLLVGCSEPNPVVGVWEVDPEASSTAAAAAAAVAGVDTIEFREDKLVIGNKTVDVAYEIDGERVIVTESGSGEGEVYTLVEGDRIGKKLPMGIVVVYRRAGSDAPVAAGGAAQP